MIVQISYIGKAIQMNKLYIVENNGLYFKNLTLAAPTQTHESDSNIRYNLHNLKSA